MNAPGYRRHLGVFSSTMLIAGSMIGSGVFSASPAAMREAAPTHPRRHLGVFSASPAAMREAAPTHPHRHLGVFSASPAAMREAAPTHPRRHPRRGRP